MNIGNRPELYRETVDVLYQAYFKGELEHGNCYACACGNIIAKKMGLKLISRNSNLTDDIHTGRGKLYWDKLNAFVDNLVRELHGSDGVKPPLSKVQEQQLQAVEYSFLEFARIEESFECADCGKNNEDWMFNGLVAVLEVLKDIHAVTEDTETLPRFKKHYSTLTS